MESLGNYLKRERELREITLSEIAKETRVRQDLLEAIEEEEFDSLPAPAFVKGFLRAYSKYVGLDSNDVILRYEDLLERREEGKTNNDTKEDKELYPPRHNLIILMPLLIIILIVYYIISMIFR